MSNIDWHNDGVGYWRLNKEKALALNEEFHALMEKYGISDSALIICRVYGDERLHVLLAQRGDEPLENIIEIAEAFHEKKFPTFDKTDVIDEIRSERHIMGEIDKEINKDDESKK